MMKRFLAWLLGLVRRPTDTRVSVGVYVFPGWADPAPEWGRVPGVQCPQEHPWAVLQTGDRVPELGYYDEREPRVTAWRCLQMRRARIDYAIYQVGWDGEALLYEHCSRNHTDAEPKFCLSFFDVLAGQEAYFAGWSREQALRWFKNLGLALMRHYGRPNYYCYRGKPVLFVGNPAGLAYYTARFGLSVGEVVAAIGTGCYLVATAVPAETFAGLRGWGFDAFTEYLHYADSWGDAVATYRWRWDEGIEAARRYGLEYWVPATAGYDSRAWGAPVEQRFVPTGAQFRLHVAEARAFALKHRQVTNLSVVLYAWNEYGEGGIIEPMGRGMLHDGDELVRALQ